MSEGVVYFTYPWWRAGIEMFNKVVKHLCCQYQGLQVFEIIHFRVFNKVIKNLCSQVHGLEVVH